MNAVTFNNAFDGLAKNRVAISNLLRTPLIDWSDLTTKDTSVREHPEAFWPSGCPKLPFNQFRVSGVFTISDGTQMKFKSLVCYDDSAEEKHSSIIIVHYCYDWSSKAEEFPTSLKPTVDVVNIKYKGENENRDTRAAIGFDCYDQKTGEPANAELRKKRQEMDVVMTAAFYTAWLQQLCIDFQNPHLFLCKKSPAVPNGKSVLWQKQREHYVLIHKTHAANKKESLGRKVIEDGPTIDRCAHSRRAHYRLLKSAKFSKKQGQKIWIKSTWVGPKEWQDRAGQIYKIVE